MSPDQWLEAFASNITVPQEAGYDGLRRWHLDEVQVEARIVDDCVVVKTGPSLFTNSRYSLELNCKMNVNPANVAGQVLRFNGIAIQDEGRVDAKAPAAFMLNKLRLISRALFVHPDHSSSASNASEGVAAATVAG